MSLASVARMDLLSVRRSWGLWSIATLLALLSALIGFATQGYGVTGADQVPHMFRQFGRMLAALFPIVALVGSYMAIAGERDDGGIKFLLGFPNTRLDVYLGKLISRVTLIAAILAFMFVAATSLAAARHGAVAVGVTVGLFALALLYGTVFVSVAVSLSASVASRSEAIAAAIGAYLVLVLLYVMPLVNVQDIARWLHHGMLGYEQDPTLYAAVAFTSPMMAYRKATNLVFSEERQVEVFPNAVEEGAELPTYLTDEFGLVILAAWVFVPTVLGYLRFRRADLQ